MPPWIQVFVGFAPGRVQSEGDSTVDAMDSSLLDKSVSDAVEWGSGLCNTTLTLFFNIFVLVFWISIFPFIVPIVSFQLDMVIQYLRCY